MDPVADHVDRRELDLGQRHCGKETMVAGVRKDGGGIPQDSSTVVKLRLLRSSRCRPRPYPCCGASTGATHEVHRRWGPTGKCVPPFANPLSSRALRQAMLSTPLSNPLHWHRAGHLTRVRRGMERGGLRRDIWWRTDRHGYCVGGPGVLPLATRHTLPSMPALLGA